ncbi:HigA family addiction module antitoxin [uncultured Sulfitobacter sp.]|uniref:HigA family addiction module antitoxin n=1 Tax=uncultured Sulfitobacter sp. TaxID=191468 RepID=UPI00260F3992|nr:HigA family addiction module antitoxin [uncultured Sulfitobacter sp.]
MSKSVITIDPIHPGEILKEEFLEPHGLSATAFAKRLGVPANRITRIIAGNSSVTADTALLLSAAFDTSAEFWLNLQTGYDLETARRDETILRKADSIEAIAAA